MARYSLFQKVLSLVQRISWFDCYVTPYTWEWRLRHRVRTFLKEMGKEGMGKTPWAPVPTAEKIRCVLLLDYSLGFGDMLYLNGLVRYLATSGIKVHVAVFPKLMGVFRTTLPEASIHNLSDGQAMSKLAGARWDVVVDCSYVVRRDWSNRAKFLLQTHAPVLATDLKIGPNPTVCSDWVDLTGCVHIGDRWAKVAERLTGHSVKRITPYVGLEPKKAPYPYVYVNAVGTRKSRTLSQEQIDRITGFLNQNNIKTFVYALGDQTVRETPFVKRVRPASFAEACRWIAGSAGVITPDTAVVHAASAYGKPQLAFFAGNFIECFGCPVEKAFAPLGDYEILTPSRRLRFSREVVPVSEIDKKTVDEALERFLQKVCTTPRDCV